jgi:hypothetical protein
VISEQVLDAEIARMTMELAVREAQDPPRVIGMQSGPAGA